MGKKSKNIEILGLKRSNNRMSKVERDVEKIQIKGERRKRKYLKIKEEENM